MKYIPILLISILFYLIIDYNFLGLGGRDDVVEDEIRNTEKTVSFYTVENDCSQNSADVSYKSHILVTEHRYDDAEIELLNALKKNHSAFC